MRILSLFQSLLIIFLLKPIYNNSNCEMQTHNFYLIPLEKKDNDTSNFEGLKKYDYMLILKTDPRNIDCYHMVFNVTFPINVNIDLSNKIIYDFISLKRFCINDLVQEDKGRYVNILGNLLEYDTKKQILGMIWIKIEKVLLYKEIEGNNKNMIYYLLKKVSEYDKENNEYILMRKMSKDINQNFQIIIANITKDKDSSSYNNYVCASDPIDKNDIQIGNEFTTYEADDYKLRENFFYNFFYQNIKYGFTVRKNLVCISYFMGKYEGTC
jgi:hypothetical protein